MKDLPVLEAKAVIMAASCFAENMGVPDLSLRELPSVLKAMRDACDALLGDTSIG